MCEISECKCWPIGLHCKVKRIRRQIVVLCKSYKCRITNWVLLLLRRPLLPLPHLPPLPPPRDCTVNHGPLQCRAMYQNALALFGHALIFFAYKHTRTNTQAHTHINTHHLRVLAVNSLATPQRAEAGAYVSVMVFLGSLRHKGCLASCPWGKIVCLHGCASLGEAKRGIMLICFGISGDYMLFFSFFLFF